MIVLLLTSRFIAALVARSLSFPLTSLALYDMAINGCKEIVIVWLVCYCVFVFICIRWLPHVNRQTQPDTMNLHVNSQRSTISKL